MKHLLILSAVCPALALLLTSRLVATPGAEIPREALEGPGGNVFFSFGSRRPEASFRVQQAMLEMGFAIRRLVRDFNEYVGAGVLGGTSHLYHLVLTSEARPSVTGRFDGPLYTSQLHA